MLNMLSIDVKNSNIDPIQEGGNVITKDENIIKNEIKIEDEIESIFTEAPDEYFIYISYTGDKDIYSNEKGISKVIEEYKLQDKFYYINVTDMKKDGNYINKLNELLKLEDQKIEKVPTIIYIKNNETPSRVSYIYACK